MRPKELTIKPERSLWTVKKKTTIRRPDVIGRYNALISSDQVNNTLIGTYSSKEHAEWIVEELKKDDEELFTESDIQNGFYGSEEYLIEPVDVDVLPFELMTIAEQNQIRDKHTEDFLEGYDADEFY